MYINLKYKEVKIRKNRICFGCNACCVVGYTMMYSVGVFEGEFSTSYWCEICDLYLKKGGFEDGVAYGEFKTEYNYIDFKNKYFI